MINRPLRSKYDRSGLLITGAVRRVSTVASLHDVPPAIGAESVGVKPADLPRVLTTDEAATLGLTPAKIRTHLRHEQWRWLASGVLLTRPDAPTRDDWIQVGLALGGSRSALSGWDVLAGLGLGGATPPDPRVLVLLPAGKNRTVGGVHLRPSSRTLNASAFPPQGSRLTGVRQASVARALADTALQFERLAPVRAMVTSAVQRGLTTTEELRDELAAAPRNGTKWLRVALHDVLAGAGSIAEAEAIEILRARMDIPPFEVNAAIRDPLGNVVAVADLLWPELRAVLEVDSREFHFSEDGWKRTQQRHNRLSRMGYAVVHYAPSDIRSRRGAWAAEVAAWLRARQRELAA
jgi:hypothetical protein